MLHKRMYDPISQQPAAELGGAVVQQPDQAALLPAVVVIAQDLGAANGNVSGWYTGCHPVNCHTANTDFVNGWEESVEMQWGACTTGVSTKLQNCT